MRNLSKAQEDPELAFIITAIYLKRQQRDIIRPFKTVLSQSANPDHMRLAALLLSDDLNDATNQSLSRNLFKRSVASREMAGIGLIVLGVVLLLNQ